MPAADLLAKARTIADDLTDLRHRLHRHPEIGLQLPRTQRAVRDALDGLDLEVSTGTTCSSVTAVLRGGAAPPGGGRVVLLRGDMDALPVTEAADAPVRSAVDGAMHACGHDLHTTMLVGAARLLHRRRADLPGDVVLMFQPGEEGYDGAGRMIAEGVLDAAGRRADAAYALHVLANTVTAGVATTRPGAMMAASASLTVVVRGRGGHGSAPHLAADPVPPACEMVLALQTAMTRRIDPLTTALLTVGTIHAGTARNVIPDEVRFEATVRTFDAATSALVAEAARQVCGGIAAAHGVDAEVSYTDDYPVTVNDRAAAERSLAVATATLGERRAVPMGNPITGSEDFSRVLAAVPGAMMFLGAVAPGRDPAEAPGNHSPRAAYDDGVLPDGAALYAALAIDALAPDRSAGDGGRSAS